MLSYKKMRAWYNGPNGEIWMRSKWEVAYAQYLDRHSIAWQYEPRCFRVGRSGYLPDFYLVREQEYIELKGRLTAKNERKLAAFRKQYPKIKWQMLRAKELIALGVLDIRGCAILR